MNKLIYLSFLPFLFTSCASFDEDLQSSQENVKSTNTVTRIDQDKAIDIAERVLSRNSNFGNTRSKISPEVSFVQSTSKTRSNTSLSDTLAYVINYPDNGGFAIISSDARVNPVLAYSHTGQFDMSNEIAKEQFIDRIEPYMETQVSLNNDTIFDIDDFIYDTCVSINPQGNYGLHQSAPFNKYVAEEHPDYPVGCVTVAAALTLTNTKWKLDYHGTTFHLYAISEALSKHNNSSNNAPKRIVNGEVDPFTKEKTYTYDEAVDQMAKLLYWLSKDLDIKYLVDEKTGEKEGKGQKEDTYQLFKQLGLDVPISFRSCNLNAMTQYLEQGYALIMGGVSTTNKGHAWVCDGWQYCYYLGNKNDIRDVYLHIDWGWGGSSNAYYSGDVLSQNHYTFKTDQFTFGLTKYMPVKCEFFSKLKPI